MSKQPPKPYDINVIRKITLENIDTNETLDAKFTEKWEPVLIRFANKKILNRAYEGFTDAFIGRGFYEKTASFWGWFKARECTPRHWGYKSRIKWIEENIRRIYEPLGYSVEVATDWDNDPCGVNINWIKTQPEHGGDPEDQPLEKSD